MQIHITHRTFWWMLLLVAIPVFLSCSTKKNTFTRRVYHNLTGHYNTFWNGRESYREGVDQLESTVTDNYNKLLPVFNYGTDQEAQSLNTYMDRAIEKASINIQRHSMYFNRREYVRWIDDSYMLIGKAYFYKHEFNKARRTFEFVINEYKNNDIRFEAMLWLGNTLIQLEKYNSAQSALDNLQNEADKNPVPKEVRKTLPLVRADLFIRQNKLPQARQYLEDAIWLGQPRKVEPRTRYILGQIYQLEGELYKASEYYLSVIKKNPPYVMAFNAGINLARCYDTRYGDSREIEKKLTKMLREDKNKDFLDQIYYALADIALKNGQDTLAISFLKLSVATSVMNNYQRAASALKLGDIYFSTREYEPAQAYYDTAMQVLPEDYPDYKQIAARTESLSDLVANLVVIQTEDSLQRLAAMPEEERLALIDKLIEDLKREEELRKEEEEQQQALADMMNQMNRGEGTSGPTSGSPTGSGNWYFYNPSALSFGFTEFTKTWGRRKLEDLWRLSDKKAVFGEEEELMAADSLASDSTQIVSTDPYKRETYLQDIPLTEEQMAASNEKIQDALYNIGLIYKDRLVDLIRAAETLEKLIERFPDTPHLLLSYYYLYLIYTDLPDPQQAELYKSLIVKEFPDSDYARLLTDPDFFRELAEKENEVARLYASTYQAYEDGSFYTVLTNSNRALDTYEEPEDILSRFAYLRALAIGKIEVADSLQKALENLVETYPDSEVIPLAQNILDFLSAPPDTATVVAEEPEIVHDISIYTFNENARQIFTLVLNDATVNTEALKVRISDFNGKNYKLDNLSITNILLDSKRQLVMVGSFAELRRATVYFQAIMNDEYVFSGIDPEDYSGFIMSQDNYPVFYKDKDVEKYLAFFREYYRIESP
ncbi:MAG: tetratricopeptide repeat protein [Bacteroidales bacterium]|nr:tetratricopeptide repeat protein [Bacteroidales bacterium]